MVNTLIAQLINKEVTRSNAFLYHSKVITDVFNKIHLAKSSQMIPRLKPAITSLT